MSYLTEETPPAGSRPHGRLSDAWERFVFTGLMLTLPSVCVSLWKMIRCDCPPAAGVATVAWLAYALVQLANKTPVSFTYTLRGLTAAIDIAALAIQIAATVMLALRLGDEVPATAWRIGLVIVALAYVLNWTHGRARMEDGTPIPLGREVFARTMSTTLAAPMVAAVALLAL